MAACTCSVPCARQSGAGSVESPGTETVWGTTGLGNAARVEDSNLLVPLNTDNQTIINYLYDCDVMCKHRIVGDVVSDAEQ